VNWIVVQWLMIQSHETPRRNKSKLSKLPSYLEQIRSTRDNISRWWVSNLNFLLLLTTNLKHHSSQSQQPALHLPDINKFDHHNNQVAYAQIIVLLLKLTTKSVTSNSNLKHSKDLLLKSQKHQFKASVHNPIPNSEMHNFRSLFHQFVHPTIRQSWEHFRRGWDSAIHTVGEVDGGQGSSDSNEALPREGATSSRRCWRDANRCSGHWATLERIETLVRHQQSFKWRWWSTEQVHEMRLLQQSGDCAQWSKRIHGYPLQRLHSNLIPSCKRKKNSNF
jgi:hypothetical protein